MKVTIEITPDDELVLRRQRSLHGLSIKRQLEMAARVYCSEAEPCRTYFNRVSAMEEGRLRTETAARLDQSEAKLNAGLMSVDDDDDGDDPF